MKKNRNFATINDSSLKKQINNIIKLISMDLNSREKLLAGVAALSLLGISPQQTFAAQITTSQAVQQTKKITGNVSDAMG